MSNSLVNQELTVRLQINKVLLENFYPDLKKAMDEGEAAFTLPKEFVKARAELLDLFKDITVKGEQNV